MLANRPNMNEDDTEDEAWDLFGPFIVVGLCFAELPLLIGGPVFFSGGILLVGTVIAAAAIPLTIGLLGLAAFYLKKCCWPRPATHQEPHPTAQQQDLNNSHRHSSRVARAARPTERKQARRGSHRNRDSYDDEQPKTPEESTSLLYKTFELSMYTNNNCHQKPHPHPTPNPHDTHYSNNHDSAHDDTDTHSSSHDYSHDSGSSSHDWSFFHDSASSFHHSALSFDIGGDSGPSFSPD